MPLWSEHPQKPITAPAAIPQRGQALAEWAGVLVVVALIILALTAASRGLASTAARSTRCSISGVFGSSACRGAAAGKPPRSTPPQPTPRQPTRAQLQAQARAILAEHTTTSSATPNTAPFVWKTDGCSVPMFAQSAAFVPSLSLGFGLQHAMDMFRPACELNDFGYRNFGKGLHLGRNENTRAEIDHHFWREMARICDDRYGAWYDKGGGEWESCEAWAKAFYAAVRNGGRSAYY
jgi:Prokaryotic phospholipase A2